MARSDFHGPMFGFYYTGSTRNIVKMVAVAMAGYSHGHEHSNTLVRGVSSLLHGGL
jgi:hypothetical protein